MVEGEAVEHPLVPPCQGLAGLPTRLLEELHVPVFQVLPPFLEVFQTDFELLCLHLPRLLLPLIVLGGAQPQVAVAPQPLHQVLLDDVRETPACLVATTTTTTLLLLCWLLWCWLLHLLRIR